jgi:hypothetical protein
MQAMKNAILAMTPVADHRTKEGYFVSVASDVATVLSSATTLPFGVIVEGENTDGVDSIAMCGEPGLFLVKASGPIAQGAAVQLHTDGSVVTDATAGARVLVGRAAEAAVSGDLFKCQLWTPVTYA